MTEWEAVLGADECYIYARNSIIPQSQCLDLILFFGLAPGTPMLGPLPSKERVCVQFIYLSMYASIAGKGKQASMHNEKDKGDCVTGGLFY